MQRGFIPAATHFTCFFRVGFLGHTLRQATEPANSKFKWPLLAEPRLPSRAGIF